MAFKDVVVLLPGISGSTLAKGDRVLWGADVGGVLSAIASGGGSIRELALTVPDDPTQDYIDDVRAVSLIPDVHLIPGLWKIDGYTKIAETLKSKLELQDGQNFFQFPYDWRRDNRVAARLLRCFALDRLTRWRTASGAQDAKLIFVAHSMGGLVARTFIEVLDGWRHTRALYTLGTPFRGSLNALGYLCNGYSKEVGPLKLDLADVLRSFTGVYQLLPTFACIERGGERKHVWEAADLPHLDNTRALAARDFYNELRTAVTKNAALDDRQASDLLAYPVIGTFQPTFVSARLVDRALSLQNTINGADDSGDGTVPAGSAVPHDLEDTAVGIRAAQVHGSLQNDDAVLNHIIGSIKGQAMNKAYFLGRTALPGLNFDDVYVAGRTQQLKVSVAEAEPVGLVADIVDARTSANANSPRRVAQCPFKKATCRDWRADFKLPKGVYRVTVRGSNVQPATDCIVVAEA